MWAVSGGLTRSKMAASNQGAEDRKMNAGREAVAAVPGAAPTVFLAIELSKASWIVALHSPAGARVSLHRLPAGDAKALLAFAEKARAAAAEATGVRSAWPTTSASRARYACKRRSPVSGRGSFMAHI